MLGSVLFSCLVCPSVRLSVCPSVRPSVCLSVCLSLWHHTQVEGVPSPLLQRRHVFKACNSSGDLF